MNKSIVKPGKVLYQKELGNAKSPVYWFSGVLMMGLMIWLSVFVPIENIKLMLISSPETASFMAKIWPQTYALIQPLWVFLLVWMFLSTEVFIAEKTDGRLEMLLTTPLKLKEIWVSKRRALFTLIYPIVLILNVFIFYLQNKIWLMQMGISTGIQPATLTLAILAAPLLAYSLGSLMGLLSFLVSNPAALQSITFLIVFAVGFGGNYLMSNLIKNASANLITWTLVGAYFGIALIVGIITLFLSRKLDKDYVISHTF